MKQETKEQVLFWALIIIKVLTGIRTGIDTYIASNDILNVLLIDLPFIALWLILAYGGKGQTAMYIRPFAGVFAGILYGFMIYIGIQAHPDQALIPIAARVAGGMMLAYDGWDYLVALWQKGQEAVDTSAEKSPKVRWKIWRLSQNFLLKEAEADSQIKHQQLALSAELQGHRLQLAATQQKALSESIHEAEIKQIPARVNSVNPVNFTQFTPPPVIPSVREVLDIPKTEIDAVDKHLIQIYTEQPGISFRQVAGMVGLTHTAVNKRVKALERLGLLERKDGKVSATKVVEGELVDQESSDPKSPTESGVF